MPDRGGILSLVLLSVVVAFAFQGTHGLYESSEGRYAEVAREMLVSGNYLEPTLDSHPHWTKPPLAYWAPAVGIKLLGRNAWGARFFNAIAFCLTALSVAAASSRLWDRRTGFVAGLVYVSSLFPVVAAAILTADTLLTMWEVMAVLAFVMSWQAPSPGTARWWNRLMWVFFGLGFFTKGPPALVPLLPLIVFYASSPKRRVMFDALGVVLFLVVGGWWYVAVTARNPGLFGYFVREEIMARNFTNKFERNPQWWAPLRVYVPVLMFALGPWLVGLIRGLWREFHLGRPNRPSFWGARGTPHRLLVLWFLLSLLVFSISKSRMVLYVLPLHAPLAMATAALVTPQIRKRSIAILAVISLAMSLGAKASMSLFSRHRNARVLYTATISAGGADARYMFLGEPAQYGLQFYFDGNIERVSVTGSESWARRKLDDVVAEVTSGDSGGRLVFVTNTRGARAAEAAFASEGVTLSRLPAYRHEIVVVDRPGRPLQ